MPSSRAPRAALEPRRRRRALPARAPAPPAPLRPPRRSVLTAASPLHRREKQGTADLARNIASLEKQLAAERQLVTALMHELPKKNMASFLSKSAHALSESESARRESSVGLD